MIKVDSLTKLYPNGKGVKDLNFEIPEGMVFGYLGPNGAGKTTTIRHLLGFLKPDNGSCTINGLDCWTKAAEIQKNMGYIPGEIAFLDGFTGQEFLSLLADMRKTKNRSRMKSLINRFDLDASGKIRKMSKGMKQKLGIIAACMHDPAIMVFDEPSAGLDPLMQNIFVEFMAEEKNRGKTILMSSHSFEEIDRTCDQAGIIRDGILVDIQDISILKETRRKAFTVTLDSAEQARSLAGAGYEIQSIRNNRIEVMIRGEVDGFIKTLSRYRVLNLETFHMTLEQVFMQYYGKEEAK